MRHSLILFLLLAVTSCGGSGGEVVCQEGASRCSGSVLERCLQNAWTAEVDCADSGKTCEENQQARTAACESQPECDEGESRCSSDVVETCSGGAWRGGLLRS